MERNDFAVRLAYLRTKKGVSARNMSLSLGQSTGYITSIESGKSLPSMTVFFYICEYLGITPSQFFDTVTKSPSSLHKLTEAAKDLSTEDIEHLPALIEKMKK